MRYTIQSPCLWWQDGSGWLRHDGVYVPLVAPPPVASLHQAFAVHWEPRREQARCIVDGARRALTADECGALDRWVMAVSTAALDARDGLRSLVVVVA